VIGEQNSLLFKGPLLGRYDEKIGSRNIKINGKGRGLIIGYAKKY